MRRVTLAGLIVAALLTLTSPAAMAGDKPLILSPNGTASSCMAAAAAAGYDRATRVRLCSRWAEDNRNAYNLPPSIYRPIGREYRMPGRRWDR